MKETVCFLLLQLVCSLCSGSENKIPPLGRELIDPPNHQETCKEDVNTVLRELSVMLAEQRVEIRQLQRENQGRRTA